MYLIPKPQQWYEKEGIFTIEYNKCIVLKDSCPVETYEDAKLLQENMKICTGFELPVRRGVPGNGDISLQMADTLAEQEYTLLIQPNGICITGGSVCGIFYGIQTLRQMISQAGCCLPYTIIVDHPQMLHRGFYHDVTRGRIPTMDYLKKLVDRMSYYKLNQLQLYMEHTFMFRDFSEVWRDDTPLTAEDILELDAYCRKRHVELVPSIACFGHLYKVLRTRSYRHLCELDRMAEEPFGFVDRMKHHTLAVSNPESMQLVKSMIDEFMPLFTSNYFNICADETFDLGKGKSADMAKEKGTQRMYLDFVRELCEYVVSKGKVPMFWGDIICDFPEAVKELPAETICLNWGYDADWPVDSTRKLSEAGARLYNCPGVSGWDQLVNQIRISYENISRMCRYAYQYGAEGVLNTDWGDCGHINHPEFSLPGMIYGAAFSWNQEIPEFEDINRQISKVAYGDDTETFVSLIARISECWKFTWRNAVDWLEQGGLKPLCCDGGDISVENPGDKMAEQNQRNVPEVVLASEEAYRVAIAELEEIKMELYRSVIHLSEAQKGQISAYLIALQGMILLQKIGIVLTENEKAESQKTDTDHSVNERMEGESQKDVQDIQRGGRQNLASELETWLYDYKKLWRSTSRESELYRIQNVICCYADWLRG